MGLLDSKFTGQVAGSVWMCAMSRAEFIDGSCMKTHEERNEEKSEERSAEKHEETREHKSEEKREDKIMEKK